MTSADQEARKVLASEEWQTSERNYLADFNISDELREALDSTLVTAYVRGYHAALEAWWLARRRRP